MSDYSSYASPEDLHQGSGALYWVVSGIAAVLLVVSAWRAWQWFEGDVERRRAVAESVAPSGVELRPAAGRLKELDQALPAPVEVDGAGDVPSAVPPVPQVSAETLSGSQRTATCRFLAAEIERLDYEFKQELPPPVLDHLSSRLAQWRSQYQAGKCAAEAPLRSGVAAQSKAAEAAAADDD